MNRLELSKAKNQLYDFLKRYSTLIVTKGCQILPMYWQDISLAIGNYIWGFFGWKFFSTILWIRNKGLSGLVTISRPEQCIVCSETSNPYAICKASMVFVGRAAFAGKLPSCPSPARLCVLQFRPPRNNQSSTSVIYTQYTYSFMHFTCI